MGGAQVKNLALMAYISVGCPSHPIMEFLDEWSVERLETIQARIVPSATKVLSASKVLSAFCFALCVHLS